METEEEKGATPPASRYKEGATGVRIDTVGTGERQGFGIQILWGRPGKGEGRARWTRRKRVGPEDTAVVDGRQRGGLRVTDDRNVTDENKRCISYGRVLVANVSLLLSYRKGDVGKVKKAIGGSALAPHMDGDRIRSSSNLSHDSRFRCKYGREAIRSAFWLTKIITERQSTWKKLTKAVSDIVRGRALLFPVARAKDARG